MKALDISPYFLEKLVLTMGSTLVLDRVLARILIFLVNYTLVDKSTPYSVYIYNHSRVFC